MAARLQHMGHAQAALQQEISHLRELAAARGLCAPEQPHPPEPYRNLASRQASSAGTSNEQVPWQAPASSAASRAPSAAAHGQAHVRLPEPYDNLVSRQPSSELAPRPAASRARPRTSPPEPHDSLASRQPSSAGASGKQASQSAADAFHPGSHAPAASLCERPRVRPRVRLLDPDSKPPSRQPSSGGAQEPATSRAGSHARLSASEALQEQRELRRELRELRALLDRRQASDAAGADTEQSPSLKDLTRDSSPPGEGATASRRLFSDTATASPVYLTGAREMFCMPHELAPQTRSHPRATISTSPSP